MARGSRCNGGPVPGRRLCRKNRAEVKTDGENTLGSMGRKTGTTEKGLAGFGTSKNRSSRGQSAPPKERPEGEKNQSK